MPTGCQYRRRTGSVEGKSSGWRGDRRSADGWGRGRRIAIDDGGFRAGGGGIGRLNAVLFARSSQRPSTPPPTSGEGWREGWFVALRMARRFGRSYSGRDGRCRRERVRPVRVAPRRDTGLSEVPAAALAAQGAWPARRAAHESRSIPSPRALTAWDRPHPRASRLRGRRPRRDRRRPAAPRADSGRRPGSPAGVRSARRRPRPGGWRRASRRGRR
jgi:hypothetical protein